MIKLVVANLVLALFLSLSCSSFAYATIINFDDLDQGLVPNGYAGLTWGTSVLSQPYADSTSFSVNSNPDFSTPHSSPKYILNGYGVPDLWFEFLSPVIFKGAWFTSPKNNSFPAQKIRFVDDLGQTSIWLELTDTSQYLTANFSGSKKVFVQPTGVFYGVQVNRGWYSMDDITYEYISVPGEHSFKITITGTGIGAVNSDPSGYISCSYSPQAGICTSTQPHNTSFTLIASPSKDSQFIAWNGACSTCIGPSCEVTLNNDKSCSATFNILPLVRIAGPVFHASISKAYSQLSEGNSATIQAQIADFTEDLHFDRSIPLTLTGGCDPTFKICDGFSTLSGSMTITHGYLIVDRIIVR